MSGPRLIIKILTWMALVLTTTMVSLNIYPSWSQYARSLEEPLFLYAISAMMSIFLIRSLSHVSRYRTIFKKPLDIRIEHTNRWAGFMFMGIIGTPVTHPNIVIQVFHFAFTILAILFCYAEIVKYYKQRSTKRLAWVGFGCAVVGMVVGAFTNAWTTGVGELIAATPIAIHVLNTNK